MTIINKKADTTIIISLALGILVLAGIGWMIYKTQATTKANIQIGCQNLIMENLGIKGECVDLKQSQELKNKNYICPMFNETCPKDKPYCCYYSEDISKS